MTSESWEPYRVILRAKKNKETVIVSAAPILAESREAAGDKAVMLFDIHFLDTVDVESVFPMNKKSVSAELRKMS
jgi:hypothetical protein